MTDPVDLMPNQLDDLERVLLGRTAVRVDAHELWLALAQVFPHRSPGPPERRLLLSALEALEQRGAIRLPPRTGRRWDRTMDPYIPISIDLTRAMEGTSAPDWRTFPWHAELRWVCECRSLSTQQVSFLRRVHDGLVYGTFSEQAPLKYRSLQLTGHEKMLRATATTSLFGKGRLSLELLGCLPEVLPLAWEAIDDHGGRLVIFENSGPFTVARRVLTEVVHRPYDLIAYGGGRGILASLGHLKTIGRVLDSIHYVGDIDLAGLDITVCARRLAGELGLPPMQSATELHRQMLVSATALGHSNGWASGAPSPGVDPRLALDAVDPELRARVRQIFDAGGRIPEEVLGPRELRAAWEP